MQGKLKSSNKKKFLLGLPLYVTSNIWDDISTVPASCSGNLTISCADTLECHDADAEQDTLTRQQHNIQTLGSLFVCLGLTSLWNIWGHITTVPACSSGTLTNVLPHRNAIPQTQDTTPHPVTVCRHGADLSLCYPLMWNVTLEYTATHFNVLGRTIDMLFIALLSLTGYWNDHAAQIFSIFLFVFFSVKFPTWILMSMIAIKMCLKCPHGLMNPNLSI